MTATCAELCVVEPLGAELADAPHEGEAQLALHARGGAGGDRLARPQQDRAQCHDPRAGAQRRGELGQRHPVDHSDDRAREQPRERDDDEALQHGDRADRDEEPARGARVPQQPRIDGPRARGARGHLIHVTHASSSLSGHAPPPVGRRPASGGGGDGRRQCTAAAAFSIRERETRFRNTQYVHPWYSSTSGRKTSAAHDMIVRV